MNIDKSLEKLGIDVQYIEVETPQIIEKTYLGDSVYCAWDGYSMILTTENGLPSDPSNTIFLEPKVLRALESFEKYMVEKYK